MSDNKNVDNPPGKGLLETIDSNIAVSSCEVSSVAGSVKTTKTYPRGSSSSKRQIKIEQAQKCLENAALVTKQIKEHRKATAELLGRPFEDDDIGDTASEMASTMSERTGYSVATDTSTTLSVQEALNIPGISENLANTLIQKELLMERIKQYKAISKTPMKTTTTTRKLPVTETKPELVKKITENDTSKLLKTISEKEEAINKMEGKIKSMNNTILDLQERIHEKDAIIDAKNMATTLMSDSLMQKEKDSASLLEDTKQQMTEMQEKFITMETEWKEEKQKLLKEIELKDEKINNLEEANKILDNSRFEISVAHSKLAEELDIKNNQICELQENLEKLTQQIQEPLPVEKDPEEEKGSREIANMEELTKKIELLEQLNCQIRQTNKELESKLAILASDTKQSLTASPSKKGSPLPTRKGGRNTASKQKSPWSNLSSEPTQQETDKKSSKADANKLDAVVQSLNKDILDKEYIISEKETLIAELRSQIAKNETIIEDLKSNISEQEKEKAIDVVDVGVTVDLLVPHPETPNVEEQQLSETQAESVEHMSPSIAELEEKLKAAQDQVAALNNEIDAANKNMIKVKSNHKLKIKQMQKTIDNFSKVSDANAEIVKLNEELHQLSQKVAELEEEKGNLQLHLVDYDSGRLTESDVYKKLVESESLAETRLKAISVLEAQKFDLVQELHELQQKYLEMEDKLADLSQLQSDQVCSEIKSVQLEEQIDQLTATRKEFELVIENLKLDKEQLNGTIKVLQEEKEELLHKLENYVQENMELTDKFEKLSAEKVSSAESIEIVESLTTQEKLELEEYNKGLLETKSDGGQSDTYKEPAVCESEKNVENLMEQITELNSRIDLFTHERQEVMEKMNKLNLENESLQEKIVDMNNQCSSLQSNIDLLNNEKHELHTLNEELNRQIEELKHERTQITKETMEMVKPVVVEETHEGAAPSVAEHDDKAADKGNNKTKTVKQLTKEILKLKNTIKEREAEIGDCQMKILSLEEQQQKQTELIQSIASYENKMKSLVDENNQLKEEIDFMRKDKESEQNLLQFKQANEILQQDIQKLHQDYSSALSTRDARVHELESVLLEYEKQIFNYGNTLQQKDKELTEYINQITKLNDISQKLKSTIELLEEEKAKDQNAELVKSLNKQIVSYQKKLAEYEEKLRVFEEEKSQLLTLKGTLETKNANLETEIKKLQDTLVEKQSVLKELQTQQQKHAEDLSAVKLQAKERDEEIHEIKLQLRKESIENEKLRTSLAQRDEKSDEYSREYEEAKENVSKLTSEKEHLTEQITALETKNKELLEKLKKFALNFKKKSTMYTELENQYHDAQKQLESKNEQLDQLLIQVETLPALQEKLKHADEEFNRLQSQKIALEQQRTEDMTHFQSEMKSFDEKVLQASEEISKLNDAINVSHKELHFAREENNTLKSQIESLNNKISDYEVELKNNTNFVTKISSLEVDINQKQAYIAELTAKCEHLEQQLNQQVFGHNAKVQERDLYIESLEAEINKYKNRICRLEESISAMEDRRHSLERKADQLDTQLQEKQRAYSEYHSQEDELVSRLAVLMDHDRVVDKQLHEIENENKDLQQKVQYLNEENQRFRKSLSDIQEHCNTLVEKASKADSAESELLKYQTQLRDMETHFKRITQEHQTLIAQRKHDIEELESEFNTQIENAIKEKKMLSEKYEKISDHVSQLEMKLQEYRSNNENLTMNIADLHKLNQDLLEKSATKEQVPSQPDYTEQYISEINKLNATVNNKNQEIGELNNKVQTLQVNNVAVVSNLEHRITEMTTQLQALTTELDHLRNEASSLKQNNDKLQELLSQRDEQIKELNERKTLTFEMNIPKTEGMIISSTIESVSEEPKLFDMSALESQIVSDDAGPSPDISQAKVPKVTERVQKQAVKELHSEGVNEPVIVPKQTYLCYKTEENVVDESDPFNSDEGWGFGEPEETTEITPGLSHLNKQILQLQTDNDRLKSDLEASNTKLLKALKKLKELKANNDMLSKELKLSKQISQSSFLDTAIEDELRTNVQDLEKKIEEITADLMKEKREKEAVKKQNEVFSNANERLTDMKEKLDNEIELWKYKFKEVNDKMSTLQWGSESKDTPDHKPLPSSKRDDVLESEMAKLEKENDELQVVIDQLTSQNKDLSNQQKQLKEEILKLNNAIQQTQQISCENCEQLNHQLLELQNNNKDILSENEKLNEKILAPCENCASLNHQLIELQNNNKVVLAENEKLNEKIRDVEGRYNNVTQDYDKLKNENGDIIKEFEELNIKCSKLEEETQQLNIVNKETNKQVADLMTELKTTKEKLLWHEQQKDNKIGSDNLDAFQMSEKYSAIEDYCSQLKSNLEERNNKITQLETENRELTEKLHGYEVQITELNAKIQNLNAENDQLLSTVTELRSSISSAVDQRGFEIAELWKQHLAQREADFQKTEQELRTQLSASEAKYEQLLDKVQSSSQEETNKLVMMEQLSSLQNKLQDKEEHLHNLQDKYAEVMNELHMLRSEIEDEKVMYENKLLSQQEEYEKQIEELTLKHEEAKKEYEEKYTVLENEITSTKTNSSDFHQRIEELEKAIEDKESQIVDLSTQLRLKDSEIYQKTHDYTITLAQRNEEFENVRKQLLAYEKKIEDLNYEKESELAVLRLKMHEKGEHFENTHKEIEAEKSALAEALNEKIVECTNLNKQINDLNEILQEHSSRTTEMQVALENQEVEIVTLKDEINSLQNLMRSSSSKIEKHVTFASDTKPGSDGEKTEPELNKELLDAVPRAELDLALYMLHQRDVRCEELTMELTQLLEERDTLQLRLSDSLRSNEELKSRYKDAGLDTSMDSSQETISELPTFSVEKEHQFVDTHRGQTSRSSSISDPDGEKPRLQAKLSELRSVKQNRDVRLRHESEQRQLDLRLLQRDVANLPPEAVDQLAQAHHTLSRDSQSTSTVLLNWLRGKSTPKVVHM